MWSTSLHRAHFNPRKRGQDAKTEAEKRGGTAGGKWPPMEIPREGRMREIVNGTSPPVDFGSNAAPNAKDELAEAEKMYQRALQEREKALGADHTLTLDTVRSLGLFYTNHGMLAEAEKLYQRALQGYEKMLGVDHISTLNTVYNLFREQSKSVLFLLLPNTI